MELSTEWREARTREIQIYRYEVRNSILYRSYEQTRGSTSCEKKQIVVPTKYRKQVLKLAHEAIVSGHMGIRQTLDRIISSFQWPGIISDVAWFCRSCDVCQRTVPKGKVSKVPLGKMTFIDKLFNHVSVDLIGPVSSI